MNALIGVFGCIYWCLLWGHPLIFGAGMTHRPNERILDVSFLGRELKDEKKKLKCSYCYNSGPGNRTLGPNLL